MKTFCVIVNQHFVYTGFASLDVAGLWADRMVPQGNAWKAVPCLDAVQWVLDNTPQGDAQDPNPDPNQDWIDNAPLPHFTA